MLEDNEKIYDEKIAPLMAQIIAICKEHKLPCHATFEYAPDAFCTTHISGEPDSAAMVMIRTAALTKGNIDAFIIAMSKHAEKSGHTSAFLYAFGNKNIAGDEGQDG